LGNEGIKMNLVAFLLGTLNWPILNLYEGRVQKKKKKSGIFQIEWVGGSEKVHFPDLKK